MFLISVCFLVPSYEIGRQLEYPEHVCAIILCVHLIEFITNWSENNRL